MCLFWPKLWFVCLSNLDSKILNKKHLLKIGFVKHKIINLNGLCKMLKLWWNIFLQQGVYIYSLYLKYHKLSKCHVSKF